MTTRPELTANGPSLNAIHGEERRDRAGLQSEVEPSSSLHLDFQQHATGFLQTIRAAN